MPYPSLLLRFGIVIISVAFACVLSLLPNYWQEIDCTAFLLFFSAVMVSAWYGGWQSGCLATLLSVVLGKYLFLYPKYDLFFDINNAVIISLFTLQGFLFSIICETLRNAKQRDELNLQGLKTSEERFRLGLSSSDIIVFQQDRDLRYRWIHNACGVENPEELLGKSDDEIFPFAIAEPLTALKRRVLEHDVSAHEEVCIILHGKILYYDLLAEPLKVNGEIQGITGAAVDITARKRSELEKAKLQRQLQEAIQQKDEYLALLNAYLACSPVALAFLDKELRYLRINQVLADVNGLSVEEHLGRKFREVLPKMAAEFEPQLQRVLDTGEPLINVELSGEILGSQKHDSYWLGNYYPVANNAGEIVGIGVILADVTATKQGEIALRESEERFRAMFNQAAVGITLVTLDGEFLQINPALCDITGYSLQELSRMNFQDITHPDDLAADWAYAEQVLTRKINGYSLEKRYVRKDGSIVWVNLTASIVWGDDGKSKYALGIIEDISERKQAEATQNFLVEVSTILAASLDYEVTLSNVANLAVPTLADWCTVDILQPDWSVKQVAIAATNPAKLEIIEELRQSYPPRTEYQHPFREKLLQGESIFHPQVSNSTLQEMVEDEQHLQLLQSLGMRSLMVIPLYSRGQIFGVISFVRGNSGRQYKLKDLALAEDIARRAATAIDNARLYQETQQAKQAAELAMSRTLRLQSITAALSEALTQEQVADVVVNQGLAALGAGTGSVVLLTEDGTTLKILQAIGYPQAVRDAWASFSITAAVPIAETARTGEPIFISNLAVFVSKYPQIADVPSLTGNHAFACIPLIVEQQIIGVLALSFVTAPKFNQEEQKFMLTLGQQCAQAIARSQHYEAEKNARAVAESTNRIKDEFLAVLSHELRTPLNPIMVWSKLLRTRQYNEDTVKQALETIERNAKLQTQLIDDLLDVSRILRGKLSLKICVVDLRMTIQEALATVSLAAEAKSITIETILSNDIVPVVGDGDRLQQVVWNLLSNAVKFTPPEGRVEVRLQQVGREAEILVMDTGKGITPEFLPHVFEHFRQADAKTNRLFGGLGLGLAIVYHLVELHGGIVQAESQGEDQGATFRVRLPLCDTLDTL